MVCNGRKQFIRHIYQCCRLNKVNHAAGANTFALIAVDLCSLHVYKKYIFRFRFLKRQPPSNMAWHVETNFINYHISQIMSFTCRMMLITLESTDKYHIKVHKCDCFSNSQINLTQKDISERIRQKKEVFHSCDSFDLILLNYKWNQYDISWWNSTKKIVPEPSFGPI